jgi:uncharacterized membrane protein
MLDNIIHSTIGGLHTLASLGALVFGTMVFLKTKGTSTHKKLGYSYVFCMYFLNISSFFISNFGGFSIFHGFAIFSILTVTAAIVPTLRRSNGWIYLHYYFMNWSVVGLYSALCAEIGTRFVGNMQEFWWVVALSSGLTALIGGLIIHTTAKKINLHSWMSSS